MLLLAAFLPRRGEKYLSGNWLEYFGEADNRLYKWLIHSSSDFLCLHLTIQFT